MSRWVIWLPHICLFIYNNLIINFKFNSSVLRKYNWGTSLVVPRWRMDLPTQGTWVWPLIGKTKIPTWREATKPGSCGEKATQRGRVSTADITKHQNMIKKLTMCSLAKELFFFGMKRLSRFLKMYFLPAPIYTVCQHSLELYKRLFHQESFR